MAKRERSVNFSSTERDLLVSLVQKYRNVLENKQSDATTWKKKEAAWVNIQSEFNAQSGTTYRCLKTLKIKYEGLKRSVRKKSAAIRSELYRTGGGKNTAPPLDTVEENIKDMISLSTDGLESVYDSDVLPQLSQVLSVENMEEFIEIPQTIINIEDKSPSNQVDGFKLEQSDVLVLTNAETKSENIALHDTNKGESVTTPVTYKKWDVTSRNNLKSKKHPALTVNLPTKPLIDELTQAKMELIQLQKSILESETIVKKKELEYKELQQLQQNEFEEKERKWKEEEYHLKYTLLLKELEFKEKEDKRKEEEHKLRLAKLKKELNELS